MQQSFETDKNKKKLSIKRNEMVSRRKESMQKCHIITKKRKTEK